MNALQTVQSRRARSLFSKVNKYFCLINAALDRDAHTYTQLHINAIVYVRYMRLPKQRGAA